LLQINILLCAHYTQTAEKIQHVVDIILFILFTFILHFAYFVHNYRVRQKKVDP